MARHSDLVKVSVSLGINDDKKAGAIEKNAPLPTARFAFVKKLADNGINVIVRLDPIIPGYSDDDEMLRNAVKRAKECGARGLIASYLYLSPGIKGAMNKNGYGEILKLVDTYYDCPKSLGGMGKKNYVFLSRRTKKYGIIEKACAEVKLDFTICKCCNFDIGCDSCGSIGVSHKLKDIEDL